jgi:hypothetical protein
LQAKREYFLPETLKARYIGHPRVRVIAIVNELPGRLNASLEVHLSPFFGLRTKTSSRSRLPVFDGCISMKNRAQEGNNIE